MREKVVDPRENAAGRCFYRIVNTDPPTETDFKSERQLFEEGDASYAFFDDGTAWCRSQWEGLSVFSKLRYAKSFAQFMFKKGNPFGRYIAEICVPTDAQVEVQLVEDPHGHYNLFAYSKMEQRHRWSSE